MQQKAKAFDPTDINDVRSASAREQRGGPEVTLAVHPNDVAIFGQSPWRLTFPKKSGYIKAQTLRQYNTVQELHNTIKGMIDNTRRDVMFSKNLILEQIDKYKKYLEPPEREIKELEAKLESFNKNLIYAFKHDITVVLDGNYGPMSSSVHAIKSVSDRVYVQTFESETDIEEKNKKIKARKCRMI